MPSVKRSHIHETLNLLTCANKSTDKKNIHKKNYSFTCQMSNVICHQCQHSHSPSPCLLPDLQRKKLLSCGISLFTQKPKIPKKSSKLSKNVNSKKNHRNYPKTVFFAFFCNILSDQKSPVQPVLSPGRWHNKQTDITTY